MKILVSITQAAYRRHHMVAPLSGDSSSSGAILTNYAVYANVISTQSSFWCRQAQISCPCDQHLSDSQQKPLGLTQKAYFAQFLETHRNSVRLGRSGIDMQHPPESGTRGIEKIQPKANTIYSRFPPYIQSPTK